MKPRVLAGAIVSCLLSLLSNSILYAQPADSPWPMFHRDVRNTGQSDQLASQDGRLLWSYGTNGDVTASPVVAADGVAYFGAGVGDNNIYALSFQGDLLWSYATGNGVQGSCSLSSSDTIYCGSSDNGFYALTTDGDFIWSYVTGGPNIGSPSEGSDGTIYLGSSDNRFYAVSSIGGLNWSYETGGEIHGCAGLGAQGDIFIGALDHRIYSMRSTGSLSWSYRFDESLVHGLEGGVVIGSDGALYFGTTSIITALYAMESSGTLRWTYHTGDIYGTPALANDGTVYFGADDNEIMTLNSNGSMNWSYFTGEDVRNGTAAIGSDGMIYASSKDGGCYAIDSLGILKWSYQIGDSECAPSIGYSGTLYVGSLDNVVCAFEGQPTPTPTQTPTPTPNYVELRVTNGTEFNPGAKVILRWDSYQDMYGFTGKPCAVYLAAALEPPAEDMPVTVNQIVSSGALFIFDSGMRPVKYNPKSLKPTFSGVRFPVPGMGSGGSLTFVAPAGAAGRWVFAAAFIRLDNKQFPAQPPVEVSNGFTLH